MYSLCKITFETITLDSPGKLVLDHVIYFLHALELQKYYVSQMSIGHAVNNLKPRATIFRPVAQLRAPSERGHTRNFETGNLVLHTNRYGLPPRPEQ